MYIMITSRCNMTCEHCCSRCTEDGIDMPQDIFEKAVDISVEQGSSITIGGGEPTLHPNFRDYLFYAIAENFICDNEIPVTIVTNGSNTKMSLLLAKLTKAEVVLANLSYGDEWHDPSLVSWEVVEAFMEKGKSLERSSLIRAYTEEQIHSVGRAKDNGFGKDGGCVCQGLIVKPDGTIVGCGCEDAPVFGNIMNGDLPPENWDWMGCSKEQELEIVR